MLNKTLSALCLVVGMAFSGVVYSQSATDNEILINQVGDTLTLTILQQGFGNKVAGNICDILIGSTGSADTGDILASIQGDSNTFDFDLASLASGERLNMDLVLLGDSNVFDIDIEVDDATWNFDITGSNNDFVTTQTDGAYQYIKVVHDGSGGNFDLVQSSGTCATGATSCYGHIDLDIDSENATVNITQSD